MIKAKFNAKRNSKSERTYPCLIPVAMSKLSVGCSLCKTLPVKVFLMIFYEFVWNATVLQFIILQNVSLSRLSNAFSKSTKATWSGDLNNSECFN